ncbi:MAG: hypothetical protein KC800_24605, partial [Candidatus Eremiobacteraeota bacterium]|nr:hypothetical protein [Candidatus Eremiobacteraeota bacterium]
MLILSLVLSACQPAIEGNSTPAKLEWPLAFQEPPLDCKVTVRGLTPGNPTDDPKWVETFGDPIVGLPGSQVTFEGPVLVECHGTSSSVDCIFSNEI